MPQSPRRILVRGVNWLGDAVMTTPSLMRLRERFPEAHIVLLTPEKLEDLWLHHPAVDEPIPFATGESLFSISRRLRAGNFDLAIVLPNSPRSAIETWLARIPHRVGYARPWRNAFLNHPVPSRYGSPWMRKRSPGEVRQLAAANANRPTAPIPASPAAAAHQIHDYLHLAAALGANPEPLAPALFVSSGEIESVRRKFGLAESDRPVFALNPGAEYGPAKRWPLERFTLAAREIQKRARCTWLILGGPGDARIASQIESGLQSPAPRLRNLAGRTSLRELCALLKLCRILLTNDTGPMHVAAALGTPVVVPFGSTSPELTGPGLPGDTTHRLIKSDAPCSPCFLRECPIDFRCMNGIPGSRVVAAVLEAASLR